jgi:hypothetical protein
MSVRGWAVGVVSTAVVLAGLVAVQSGIAGTSALPVLPHRVSAAQSGGDAELPAPTEPAVPPPAAGAVREPVTRTVVVVPDRGPAAAAHRAATRPGPPAGDSGKGPKDSPEQSGKDKEPKDSEKPAKHSDDRAG